MAVAVEIGSTAPKQYVREDGDRTEAQAQDMQLSREEESCPFCEIVAQHRPDQPVLHRHNGWVVAKCKPEEKYTRHHYLVISEVHPKSNHFDSLPPEHLRSQEDVIQWIVRAYGLWDGYSVVSRRGPDGRLNAQTVYHPCTHVIASNGLPVPFGDITPEHRQIIQLNRAQIEQVLLQQMPDKVERAAARAGGIDAIFSEALKLFVDSANLYRSHLEGKAGPIWVKLSNEATERKD